MAEIVLENVTKRFADGTVAVNRANFTIQDGEFFILVGPSGCGKSSLLNMIVGLEEVSEGEIRLNGKVINDIDPKDRNMAMVFQSYAIYPHMTVRENMAFPLKMAKLPKKEIERRVAEAAGILELDHLLDRKPHSLSGGQRQRVAMGRAIVRKPEVFLLDEPLSNLDAKLRVQMRMEIARLQKRLGTTTVYVTHDQTEAMTLGERAAVLRKGRVQQVGTPKELYETPANLFVAGFIGSPAMNFLPAELDGDRLKLPMMELPLPQKFRARRHDLPRRLVAGIRPEHFSLTSDQNAGMFTATAEVAEWLGAELYVYFTIEGERSLAGTLPDEFSVEGDKGGGLPLVARLEAVTEITRGQPLLLRLDLEKLHLFDSETGARIPAEDTAP